MKGEDETTDSFRVTKSGRLIRSIDTPSPVFRDDRPAKERLARAVPLGNGVYRIERPKLQRTFLEEAGQGGCSHADCPGVCVDCAEEKS